MRNVNYFSLLQQQQKTPLFIGSPCIMSDAFSPLVIQLTCSRLPNLHRKGKPQNLVLGIARTARYTAGVAVPLRWCNKKLSYRRETARQLPTWRGARPSSPLTCRPLWLHLCVWSNPKPATNVRQACRPLSAMDRAFKVIQGHPYWCRQESTTV